MTLLALLAIACAGAAVAALAWAVAVPRARAESRLREIDEYGYGADPTPTPSAATAAPSTQIAARRLGALLSGRVGPGWQAEKKRKLLSAGLYNVDPTTLLGYQAGLAGIMGAMGLISDPIPQIGGPLLDTALFGVLGWVTPGTFVDRRARFRLEKIDRGLPDVIDLLVVNVEAGAGFAASLASAAERGSGPLGDELRLTLQEQRFGLTLQQALVNFHDRADTPNVRTFVRGVVQGESLGVSIGQIMRGIAHEMRIRRRQAAEERAMKAPVKMLFPLVFLILPALFVVILGPAVMSFTQALG